MIPNQNLLKVTLKFTWEFNEQIITQDTFKAEKQDQRTHCTSCQGLL
jgi:hypothetical protein